MTRPILHWIQFDKHLIRQIDNYKNGCSICDLSNFYFISNVIATLMELIAFSEWNNRMDDTFEDIASNVLLIAQKKKSADF